MYEDRRLYYIHSTKYHIFSLEVTYINLVFLIDVNYKKKILKKKYKTNLLLRMLDGQQINHKICLQIFKFQI